MTVTESQRARLRMVSFDLRPQDDAEMRLVIACARAAIDPAQAALIRELAADDRLDWDRLLALAARNGLRPLLFWHLHRICPAQVPAGTLAFLRDFFQKHSAFSLLLTGELLRLLALLRDRGIEAVPFKGPAQAAALYGHLALRQYGDLDILVRERDVWRASEVIAAQGFEPEAHIPDARRDDFVRQDYVQLFRRDRGRTIVELHWGIARRSFAVPFAADTVWPRLTRLALQGQTVQVPGAEDLLLMLSVHGARHGWDKLEGLSSVAAIVQGTPALDWPYVWQRAGEMHCRRMLAFTLLLAHSLFEVPLHAEAAALMHAPADHALAAEVVRDLADETGQARPLARQAALQLRLKDSHADQARYCVRVVLTPTPDDWAAVDLRGPLSLAYPLVRALRVARASFTVHQAAGGCP